MMHGNTKLKSRGCIVHDIQTLLNRRFEDRNVVNVLIMVICYVTFCSPVGRYCTRDKGLRHGVGS